MRPVRVAAVQLRSGPDAQENREQISWQFDHCLRDLCDLVVLPEASQHSFGAPGTSLAAGGEPLDGPFVSHLLTLAARHHTVIAAGMFEISSPNELPYNTTVVVEPSGSVLAYRKIHLYDALGFEESAGVRAGPIEPSEFVVTTISSIRVGIMTCFDLRFPEMSRVLVDRGAQVIALGAAWVPGPHKRSQLRTLLRARAIESTAYVVVASQPGPSYCGATQVIDPSGTVLIEAGSDEEAAVFASIDRSTVESVRSSMPVLASRRLSSLPCL